MSDARFLLDRRHPLLLVGTTEHAKPTAAQGREEIAP
jgi:hypothetical protein